MTTRPTEGIGLTGSRTRSEGAGNQEPSTRKKEGIGSARNLVQSIVTHAKTIRTDRQQTRLKGRIHHPVGDSRRRAVAVAEEQAGEGPAATTN